MNWGNKLLLVFAAFGGMISYMVYRCMQTPVDLVNKDYYRDELVYQEVIDGSQKANALSGKLKLRQEAGIISLQLPEEMKNTGSGLKGTIFFYCPSDATKDRRLLLQTDSVARQEIGIEGKALRPGHYTVKVQWENKGIHYFSEQPFFVQ